MYTWFLLLTITLVTVRNIFATNGWLFPSKKSFLRIIKSFVWEFLLAVLYFITYNAQHLPGTDHPDKQSNDDEENNSSCDSSSDVSEFRLVFTMGSNKWSNTTTRWLASRVLHTCSLVFTEATTHIWKTLIV